MFNGSNCDGKLQLSGILTEPLNPHVLSTCDDMIQNIVLVYGSAGLNMHP